MAPLLIPRVNPLDGLITISTLSLCAVGGTMLTTSASLPSSSGWPVANTAYYVPFRIATPFLARKLFWYNGTVAVAPNVDCGIFYPNGAQIISTGSTLMATSSVQQVVDVTDTWLDSGLYYLALAASGVGSGFMRFTGQQAARTAGVCEQIDALPLPATMTPTALVSSFVPVIGVTGRAAF